MKIIKHSLLPFLSLCIVPQETFDQTMGDSLDFNDDCKAGEKREVIVASSSDSSDSEQPIKRLFDTCGVRNTNLSDEARRKLFSFLNGEAQEIFNGYARRNPVDMFTKLEKCYYQTKTTKALPEGMSHYLAMKPDLYQLLAIGMEWFRKHKCGDGLYSPEIDKVVMKLLTVPPKHLTTLERLYQLFGETVDALNDIGQDDLHEAFMPAIKNAYVGAYRAELEEQNICKWEGNKVLAYALYLMAVYVEFGEHDIPTIGAFNSGLNKIIDDEVLLNNSYELMMYMVFGSVFGTQVCALASFRSVRFVV